MRRRRFLVGLAVVPLLGFARPEALPLRRSKFEEVGDAVRMSVGVPGLFRRHDREALASIDSGFDTTLVYSLKIWQHGSRRLVATSTVIVKLRRDIWQQRYVVNTLAEGRWSRRYFDTREAAIASAIDLQRALLCAADDLERGSAGPYYFVEVLALRNPLAPRSGAMRRDDASKGSSGRDLEWFGRLVEVLAGERPRAEEVVHFRTNPFYLVPR